MSTILLNTIPTISSKSLNINVMRFIEFLNDNLFIIFSVLLVLGLFIFMNEKSTNLTNSNTNLSSQNTYNVNFGSGGARSSSNASDNVSNNSSSLGPVAAATGISGVFATAAATMVKTNPRAAVTTAGIGATAGLGAYVAGEMIQGFKEERKDMREMSERLSSNSFERTGSPPPDGNFKVNSPNENGNNLIEFISKLFENPQDLANLLNEYLTGSDGNPTPALILVICSFAFWGIVCCIFLIMSMLSKQFKIEDRKFVTSRPLLHKLVCFMISLRDWNNFILQILTLVCFIGILIMCYYLNDVFWFTDTYK